MRYNAKRRGPTGIPYMYRFLKSVKRIGKRQDRVLDSGFTEGQTYGALDKAWFAFFLSCKYGEQENRKYYAAVIQKLESELGIPVHSFFDLKMSALAFYSKNAHLFPDEVKGEEVIETMLDDPNWMDRLQDNASNERFSS